MDRLSLTPKPNVAGIGASFDFYRRAAGFSRISDEAQLKDWRWAHLGVDGTQLMLSESGGPHAAMRAGDPMAESEPDCLGWATIFYLRTDDVAADRERCEREGFAPTPVRDSFYDRREFQMRDPDGHVLWIGQDLGADGSTPMA